MEKLSMSDDLYKELIPIPYTLGNDYHGAPVNFINYHGIKNLLKNCKEVYDIHSDYNGFGIAYNSEKVSKKTLKKVQQIIEDLSRYPCFDEDALSGYEHKIILHGIKDKWSGIRDNMKELHVKCSPENFSEIAYSWTEFQGFSSPFSIDFNDDTVTKMLKELIEQGRIETIRGKHE